MSADFLKSIQAMIALTGPVAIDKFMELATHHYYANQQPFGVDGDFITAPEVSQMFGHTLAMWLAQRWLDMGAPPLCIAELGPGRGVMIVDVLKGCSRLPGFMEAMQSVYLVERSAQLRKVQASYLLQNGFEGAVGSGKVIWLDNIEDIHNDTGNSAIFLLANEFFDALPVKQYVCEQGRVFEVCVGMSDGQLVRMLMDSGIEPSQLGIADQQLLEISPVSQSYLVRLIALMQSFKRYAGIIIDYGYLELPYTNTIQAVLKHQKVDALQYAGMADITSLVDFTSLARQLASRNVQYSIMTQGEFLLRHHIQKRAAILMRAGQKRRVVEQQLHRLVAPDQMGELFKALEIVG